MTHQNFTTKTERQNERGDRLLEFCWEENIMIANTWFQIPPSRLYTWKSSAYNSQKLVCHQVDYILINGRFKSSAKGACSYPGADVPSDHVLMVAVIKITLAKSKKLNTNKKIALEKMEDPMIRDEVSREINTQIHNISTSIENDLTYSWTKI